MTAMEKRFSGRSMKQSYDWRLIGIYLALVFIGLVNIYASIHSSEPSSIFDLSVRSGMQCIWIATAFGLAALILFVIPPRVWEGAALPMYLGVLFLLVVVIFVGVDVKGSRSWFSFGPVRFQPAEISKITTSLLLALIISSQNFKMNRLKDFMKVALVIAIPMLVIVAEKETGSALVYTGFIFMLYREGLSGWILAFIGVTILMFILTLTASPYTAIVVLLAIAMLANSLRGREAVRNTLICAAVVAVLVFLPSYISKPMYVLIGLVVVAVPVLCYLAYKHKNGFLFFTVIGTVIGIMLSFSTDIIFNKVMQEHQRKRIEVLLGIKDDPAGVGYNVNQSMIAIGSGGFSGKGYLQGTQTTYGFVPEQSTDFIFCTVGEEWGFLGCLLVIGLYIALIWRIITDAEKSREHFTRVYGYCVASCLFMHLFINIGMTIGLMPVIGIPLPMMSYGGSSLWGFTIMIFVFVVLDHQEKKYF